MLTIVRPFKVHSQRYFSNLTGKKNVPLVYQTLGTLVDESADKFENRLAFVSLQENVKYTYADIRKTTDYLAENILNLGLKPGDRAAIWGPNTSSWYLTFLALAKAGIISVLLNPGFQKPEIEYCLNKVNARSVFAFQAGKYQNYFDILNELTDTKTVNLDLVIASNDNGMNDLVSFEEIMRNPYSTNRLDDVGNQLTPENILNIQFTSGTTGHPKAATIKHHTLTNNALIQARNYSVLNEHHTICTAMPFSHIFGISFNICALLSAGSTLYIPSVTYDPKALVSCIQNEKCSMFNGTPTMYVDLLRISEGYDLSSLRFGLIGGASSTPALLEAIGQRLPNMTIHPAYGMTELSGTVTQPVDCKNREHCQHITDHIEAKVVDSNSNIVPFGQPGELYIRGYALFSGYWNDSESTQKNFDQDGWFKTGDQAILEKEGCLTICGRSKEMINRGGENIFPVEIENVLGTHPDIQENYVFGVEDERMGEEIFACVRTRNNKVITVDDLRQFCKGKIASFKIPKYVETVSDFPKTTSGKVQKHVLKQIFGKNKS